MIAMFIFILGGYGSSNADLSTLVPVAQLDRALACGAKGQRFESSRVYHRYFGNPWRNG